jgi:hypothetical protein
MEGGGCPVGELASGHAPHRRGGGGRYTGRHRHAVHTVRCLNRGGGPIEGKGVWAVVVDRGPVALDRPKGIVPNSTYSKLFKWIGIDLIQRWSFLAQKI